MDEKEIENYKKAGRISKDIREYIKEIVKPRVPLLELIRKINNKIEEFGAIPAFPVNLSIDDVAAHSHPRIDDDNLARGLLKVDWGISIDGFIADSAISIDLTEDNKHKELIDSVELALDNALKLLKENPSLHRIGETIQNTIESRGFSPIVNLTGHGIGRYNVHQSPTIPNYGNNNENKLGSGVYAIEPFATTGEGRIKNGGDGYIYEIVNEKNARSPMARKILDYVLNKYKTLPFSLLELQEKFGPMAKLGLKELENQGIINSHKVLIQVDKKPVAQAEHTFIKTDDNEIIVIT